jgi:hypothetical protein
MIGGRRRKTRRKAVKEAIEFAEESPRHVQILLSLFDPPCVGIYPPCYLSSEDYIAQTSE